MCDFCDSQSAEQHECTHCGRMFCLDDGYLRKNETEISDWLCYECDAELLNKDELQASSEKVLDIMAARGLDLRPYQKINLIP